MKALILTALLVTSTLTQADEIYLSGKIQRPLKVKIERDMYVLNNLNFKDPGQKILEYMGLTNLNSSTASQWLNDRVKYIIEENALSPAKLLFKRAIYVEQANVSFPNANILPYSLDPNNQKSQFQISTAKETDSVTVMSNMSAALYLGGKSSSTLYGMKVSRGSFKKQIKVAIDSPRAGIIQVGEGLFHELLTINPQKEDAVANSLNRLGTFFHEARHSDGNGASLAFAHSRCPAGHYLAGQYACDESLNGPYAIGALMTIELIKSCDYQCSEREREMLKLIAFDSISRIMTTTTKGTPVVKWDPTPEGL